MQPLRSPFIDMRKLAFTLVELLVVIAIIVVLISLLAPALDRAGYEAQLVQCGAKMKTGVYGSNQYAFNNRRHYPAKAVSGGHVPNWVRSPGDYDLIKDLRPYIGVETF